MFDNSIEEEGGIVVEGVIQHVEQTRRQDRERMEEDDI